MNKSKKYNNCCLESINIQILNIQITGKNNIDSSLKLIYELLCIKCNTNYRTNWLQENIRCDYLDDVLENAFDITKGLRNEN